MTRALEVVKTKEEDVLTFLAKGTQVAPTLTFK